MRQVHRQLYDTSNVAKTTARPAHMELTNELEMLGCSFVDNQRPTAGGRLGCVVIVTDGWSAAIRPAAAR
jgi:hypothetical protein